MYIYIYTVYQYCSNVSETRKQISRLRIQAYLFLMLFFELQTLANDRINHLDFDSKVEMYVRVQKGGLFSDHFDIRISVPMFYLKVCSHISIYIESYRKQNDSKQKKLTLSITKSLIIIAVFLVPQEERKREVPAISVDTLRGGKKETLNINVVGIIQWLIQ